MKKTLLTSILGAILITASILVTPATASAHDAGRMSTIDERDSLANHSERFSFNYQFASDSDHRFTLGRPTPFDSFVPTDVRSVNMRRDANVSLRPPQYGIFSGHIPTAPVSRWFPQPVNPAFRAVVLDSPNVDWNFRAVQHDNNVHTSNSLQNSGSGEFLPPTSMLR